MLIIPAIDLKDGHCVRLKQGIMEDATVFSDNPGPKLQKTMLIHNRPLKAPFQNKPGFVYSAKPIHKITKQMIIKQAQGDLYKPFVKDIIKLLIITSPALFNFVAYGFDSL